MGTFCIVHISPQEHLGCNFSIILEQARFKTGIFLKDRQETKNIREGKLVFYFCCYHQNLQKGILFSCDYFQFTYTVPIIFQSLEINTFNITAIIQKLYSLLHIIGNFSLYIGKPFRFCKVSYISITDLQLFVSKIYRNVVYKL